MWRCTVCGICKDVKYVKMKNMKKCGICEDVKTEKM